MDTTHPHQDHPGHTAARCCPPPNDVPPKKKRKEYRIGTAGQQTRRKAVLRPHLHHGHGRVNPGWQRNLNRVLVPFAPDAHPFFNVGRSHLVSERHNKLGDLLDVDHVVIVFPCGHEERVRNCEGVVRVMLTPSWAVTSTQPQAKYRHATLVHDICTPTPRDREATSDASMMVPRFLGPAIHHPSPTHPHARTHHPVSG